MATAKTPKTTPSEPAPALDGQPDVQDVRSFAAKALPADFDREITKQQYRDTTQHEQLKKTLHELGVQLYPQIAEYLGREVKKVVVVTGVGMSTGKFPEGGAVFMVDSVEKGDLAIFPTREGAAAVRYPAERGRLAVIKASANYVLHATPNRVRAVLIFS